MSAIWGLIDFSGNTISSSIPSQMKKPYENYKIDSYQDYLQKNCYLGLGLQYITTESYYEKMPIENERYLFTADCLLDNRDELMSSLHIQDTDTPDGKIIWNAFLQYGLDFAHHLQGLYAIAIYDKLEKKVYLVNDRNACRCLYYYHTTEFCCFSTLIQPILNIFTDISISHEYISDYLSAPSLYPVVTCNTTPYEGIFKLPPATIVTISSNSFLEKTYWSYKTKRISHKKMNHIECGEQFLNTLDECTKSALRTDGEVGISLSSGLDSSTISVSASSLLKKSGKNLFSYTYIPANDSTYVTEKDYVYNEKEDVLKNVELHPNIVPHFLTNDNKNCLCDLDGIIDIVEIPIKSIPNFPSLNEVYASAHKDNCKVVLTGQCGNNTISYGNFQSSLFDLLIHFHFIRAIKFIHKYSYRYKIRKRILYKFAIKTYFYLFIGMFGDYYNPVKIGSPYMNKNYINLKEQKKRLRAVKLSGNPNYVISSSKYPKIAHIPNLLTYLGEINTKFGLYYGLVIRDPSCDIRMLSFCGKIPYEYFTYNGIDRWLVIGNMTKQLPHTYFHYGRYGLQNSDWVFRINRDKEELYPCLLQDINEFKKYNEVDYDLILHDIEEWNTLNGNENYENLLGIMIPISLGKFLQKR